MPWGTSYTSSRNVPDLLVLQRLCVAWKKQNRSFAGNSRRIHQSDTARYNSEYSTETKVSSPVQRVWAPGSFFRQLWLKSTALHRRLQEAKITMRCNRVMPLAMASCQNAIFWKWYYGTMHIQLKTFLSYVLPFKQGAVVSAILHIRTLTVVFFFSRSFPPSPQQLTDVIKPQSFGQHTFSFFGWTCAEGL